MQSNTISSKSFSLEVGVSTGVSGTNVQLRRPITWMALSTIFGVITFCGVGRFLSCGVEVLYSGCDNLHCVQLMMVFSDSELLDLVNSEF